MSSQATTSAPSESGRDEALPSPYLILNHLLKHRRSIAVITGVSIALVAAYVLLTPRTYTSTASFMPTNSDATSSRAGGLAAQFGISLGTPSEDSPPFYADLATGRVILEPLLTRPYQVTTDGRLHSTTLLELYELGDLPRPLQIERGLEKLRRQVSASPELRTSVVQLEAHTPWPEISEALLQDVLRNIAAFNVNRRQTQAAAQRDFARDRLDAASAEVREAEGRQLAFLQANRDYRNSPLLSFQQERLARQVELKQQLVTLLTQSYEQARIEAARATPVITVIESPRRPAQPDRRHLLSKLVLALLGGFLVGVTWSVVGAVLSRARGDDPASYARFQSLSDDVRKDLRIVSLRGTKQSTPE